MNWSWGFVNRNGKCNCLRERNGLSGFRVWVKRNFFFLSSSRPIAFRFVSCRRFVRPLVQLRFVSFRVDASRFVSFRVAASFVLSFSCVSFRSVSTRRGEKERNKQRKTTTNPQLLSAFGWPFLLKNFRSKVTLVQWQQGLFSRPFTLQG